MSILTNTPAPVLTYASDIRTAASWLEIHTGSLGMAALTQGQDPFASGFGIRALALGHPNRDSLVFPADPTLVKQIGRVLWPIDGGTRRVWAHNARELAWAVRSVVDIDLNSLRCTKTAAQTIWPGRTAPRTGHRVGVYSLASLSNYAAKALEALRVVSGARPGTAMNVWLPAVLEHRDSRDVAVQQAVAALAVETILLTKPLAESPHRGAIEARVLADQTWRWQGYEGIGINKAAVLQAEGQMRVQAAMAAADKRLGFDVSNPERAKEWCATHGITLPSTRTGTPTLSTKTIQDAVVPEHLAGAWAVFLRARALGSFTGKLKEILGAVDAQGRVHPAIDIFTQGATTGRMAISRPALQNLSNSEMQIPGMDTLRNALVADPGKVLVSCDLAHVEPSILAAVSGDLAMIAVVQPGRDVYVETAAILWGPGARAGDPAAKVLRARAKTLLLALIYGKGAAALAGDLGVDVPEAKRLRDQLLGAYPQAAAWTAETRTRSEAGEVLTTIFGRPLAAPDRGADGKIQGYKAVNYAIQGSAADLFVDMANAVAAERPAGSRLWLPVHDELVVECLPEDAGTVKELLGRCMSTTVNGVPIWGEPEILGATWRK